MAVAGMLGSASATRFSDTSHSMPYKGNRSNMRMRFVDGVWKTPFVYPWNNPFLAANYQLRENPTDHYPLLPLTLVDTTPNIYGELDGIYYVSGFNNAVEHTIDVNGDTYLVMQDVWRTSHTDYYAMKLV
jgi:hypothetical protein